MAKEKENLKEDSKVELYDFQSVTSIPEDQKKTLSLLHEKYASSLAVTLTSFLCTDTFVTLDKVEQLTFANYLEQLESPTSIGVFTLSPLHGYAVLEVNASIMFAIVNRMLGGECVVPKEIRAFTEIEFAVVQKVLQILLKDLEKIWESLLAFSFQLRETEDNPLFLKVIPKNEVCITFSFNVKIGEGAGLMTLAIPYSYLEPIYSKLGTQVSWLGEHQVSEAILGIHRKNFQDVEFALNAVLGKLELSIQDLLLLQEGDVVDLGSRMRDPITLKISGKEKFLVKPGLKGKYKAVLIEEGMKEKING